MFRDTNTTPVESNCSPGSNYPKGTKTMNAWLFQDTRQKQKLGDKAPWSVGWYDPDGKKKSKRIGSKSMAEKFRKKTEGQLAAGTYEGNAKKSWADFRAEYETKIAAAMNVGTKRETLHGLDLFERIVKPKRVDVIKTQTIDAYTAKRRTERGKKEKSIISAATVNKELRHIRAVLQVAEDWGYLAKRPKFRMIKEPQKLVRYVTPEHFAAIYGACEVAKRPASDAYEAATWWRALLTFCYMTGWRISEPLALRWDDVSLDAGTAVTRWDDNKGKRSECVPLHPVVVEHLRKIVDFGQQVFFWPHSDRTLWRDFTAIQVEAGIHLPCREKHTHNASCHSYGFHDLRRAFATSNAEQLTPDALQRLMRHKSYTTTQKYINMAKQIDKAVEQLFVPDVLKGLDDD